MELERSVLEAKSRDELQSIAEALGGKPGSRARKGQIVDMILEISGVSLDGGGDDGGGGGSDGGAGEPAESGSSGSSGSGSGAGDDEGAEGDESDEPKRGRSRIRKPTAEEQSGRGDSGSSQDQGSDERDSNDSSGRGGQPKGDRAPADRSGGDRGDRGDRQGKSQRSDKSDKSDRSDKSDKSDRSDKSGDRNRSADNGGGRNRNGGRNDGDNGQQNNRNDGSRKDRGQGGNDRNQGGGDEVEAGNRRRRRRRGGRDEEQFTGDPVPVEGYLDLRDEGYGFLRVDGFRPSANDCYVSVKLVRQHGLRPGDHVSGGSRPASRNEKNPALIDVATLNGEDPSKGRDRRNFDELTPLFPDSQLVMERSGSSVDDMTTRIIDLVSPIGKGQRGLIVSPPKAGKTTIMKHIVRSVEKNNPEVELIVLLLDERPEEVTDMVRHLDNGTVAASTFDRPPEEHTQLAELVLERAKRLVEEGKDVVLVVDGITRLARAYNLAASGTGRLLSGGVDAGALYPPKRFFGAARNVEEGGSLTILATALVDTGSRMDEVIFEEFKGTGNMELRLDRRLAEKRLFPAIDLLGSSTRHEELLFDPKAVAAVSKLRRVLDGLAEESGPAAGLDMLIERLQGLKTNADFLTELAKAK